MTTDYLLSLLTLWAIFAIMATVVAALAEDAGFLHVGSMAFVGIGAYTAALLSMQARVGPQLALLATIPVGAAVGGAFHLAVRRLRGDVLALATLAAGVIGHGVMLNAQPVTGGPMGIAGIPRRPPLTGYEGLDALVLLALVVTGVTVTQRSRFGMRVCALRDDEALAEDLELRPARVRCTLWVASSAVLSLAGGLYASHLRYIDPSSFTVRESVTVLAMAVLVPNLRGVNATVGALAFIAFPEFLRFLGLPAGVGAEVRQLLFGIALLVVVARAGGRFGGITPAGGSRA